jgi:MAF protein
MSDTTQIILASASPRRRELLAALGVEFIVMPANVNEDPLPGETPLETQHRITREKAQSAIQNLKSEIENTTIIACDTTVLLDGEMLNKPADADEARGMLRKLRGRAHEVQSAIVIRQGDEESIDIVTSQVVMRDYSDEEIDAYIATGDPYDKAGSYAVQHPQFSPVHEIRGCPLNVIGLALCHVQARLPHLPASAAVCAAYFGQPCPEQLDDPGHAVRGQAQHE